MTPGKYQPTPEEVRAMLLVAPEVGIPPNWVMDLMRDFIGWGMACIEDGETRKETFERLAATAFYAGVWSDRLGWDTELIAIPAESAL